MLGVTFFPRPARVSIRTPSRFCHLEVPGGPTLARMREWTFPMSNWTFANWNERGSTRISRVHASNNSVFRRCGEKKTARLDYNDKKTNAGEDCNSADIVSKVIRLKKQARKTSKLRLQRRLEQKRARLKRETPEQSELRRQAQRRRSQEQRQDMLTQGLVKTSNFVFRDNVSMFTCELVLCFRGCDILSKMPINATLFF